MQKIKSIPKKLLALVFSLLIFGGLFFAEGASAATYTVCAAGCDASSLTALFGGGALIPGDIINVGASYATTSETFPLDFPTTGLTLDCQNSGALIGNASGTLGTINMNHDTTITNCSFNYAHIRAFGDNNVTISNNTATGRNTVFVNGCNNFNFDNNHTFTTIEFQGVLNSSITNSSITAEALDNYAVSLNACSNIEVSQNNINHDALVGGWPSCITISNASVGITVATNTLSMLPGHGNNTGGNVIGMHDSDSVVSGNNFIFGSPTNASYYNGILISASNSEARLVTYKNTLKINNDCTLCDGFTYSHWDAGNKIYATSTFNLLYIPEASSTAATGAFSSFSEGPASDFVYYSDYNAAINFKTVDSPTIPLGTNSYTSPDPYFKTNDADPNNDFELSPFSFYLDIIGTSDIGSTEQSRVTHYYIDDDGVVDYINVHATYTTPVFDSLRNGDSVTFYAGTYSPMEIQTNSNFTGNVTITGSGANTIFLGSGTTSAVSINDLATSTFSNFLARNSSSTISAAYTMTRAQFTDGTTTYDQGASLGAPNATMIVTGTPGGGTCSNIIVDNDGDSIPTAIGENGQNWNIGLIDYGGTKLTVFGPANYVTSSSSIVNCAAPGLITVEHYVEDIFTSDGTRLTYNSAAAAAAGVSPKPGETTPPAITRHETAYGAGIRLNNTSNLTFSNVTSTANDTGLMFLGTSASNTFQNSDISGNFANDVFYESTGDNLFSDTYFSFSNSSFQSAGILTAQFPTRVRVLGTSGEAIVGASVELKSANLNIYNLTTGAGGYTPYTNAITAFTLSSADFSATAGGFNPYSARISSASGYADETQNFTISTNRQTLTINLSNPVPSAPAPSGSSGGPGWGTIAPVELSGRFFSSTNVGAPASTGSGSAFTMHGLVKLSDDGNPNTQEDSAVYYLGTDGMRHAFPNEKVFFSWYCDFSSVKTITPREMASIPLGQNVTYRPGLRAVKFLSNPTVYIVRPGSKLSPIQSQEDAKALLGANWNRKIHDIPDTFYTDYQISANPTQLNSKDTNLSPQHISANLNLSGNTNTGLAAPDTCLKSDDSTRANSSWPLQSVPNTWRFKNDLSPYVNDLVAVRALQETLALMGPDIYPEAMITGSYGELTTKAVRRYQEQSGLPNVGVVGPATRAKLNEFLERWE